MTNESIYISSYFRNVNTHFSNAASDYLVGARETMCCSKCLPKSGHLSKSQQKKVHEAPEGTAVSSKAWALKRRFIMDERRALLMAGAAMLRKTKRPEKNSAPASTDDSACQGSPHQINQSGSDPVCRAAGNPVR